MGKDNMLEQLRKIPHGALLKVMWLDAATVRSASLKKHIPNYYVETRRTTVGSFVCMQRGRAQGAWHVLLEMDSTEGSGSTVRSIPVCLIYKVVGGKTAEESGRAVRSRERPSIRLCDGSVKIVAR